MSSAVGTQSENRQLRKMNSEIRPFTVPTPNEMYNRPYDVEEEPREELEGTIERFLAQELGNPPFDLELNAASFNYMSKDELLEILDKVLETVSPEKMETIYAAANKTEQILDFLKVLSYPGVGEGEFSKNLQTGIENGDVHVLTSLMAWLLANIPLLQTRTYLSKFLTRVEVPDEVFYEDDVLNLYGQYEELIEKFKTTLKRREALTHKKPLAEVKEDVIQIQQDMDCLRRKLEMAKTKTNRSPVCGEEIIYAIRNLRFQKQKHFDLVDQEGSEIRREQQMTERLEFLKAMFGDVCKSWQNLNPKSLLQRETQEVVVVREIAKVKLPKCIGQLRRKIKAIKCVTEDPPRTVNDLENTRRSIQVVKADCKRLETALEHLKAKEMNQDIVLARSKAEESRHRFTELCDELSLLADENEMIKTQVTQKSLEVLEKRRSHDADHDYVKKLRVKANIYKEKKAELDALRTEFSVLEKTYQQLQDDLRNGKIDVEDYAGEFNFKQGHTDLQTQLEKQSMHKQDLDERKQGSMKLYSEKIRALNKELDDRKERIQPLIQHVNAVRERSEILEIEYQKQKDVFSGVGLVGEAESLNRDIFEIQNEVEDIKVERTRLEMETKFKRLDLERACETSFDADNRETWLHGAGCSFSQRVLGKIVEQERVHRDLIQEEGDLEHKQRQNEVQQEMYGDLVRLLKFKKSNFQ